MSRDPLHICIVLFALILTLFSVVICSLAYFAANNDSTAWFNSNKQDITSIYHTELTPSSWVDGLWGFVYVWQIAWILHHFVVVCKKQEDQIEEPISAVILAIYAIAIGILNATFFCFDRYNFIVHLGLISLTSLLFFICLGMHVYNVSKIRREFFQTFRSNFIEGHVFFQNGMALIFSWTCLGALLSLAVTIVYKAGHDQHVSSAISLSLLVLFLIISVLVENNIHEGPGSYILAHWFVVIWVLIGCSVENWGTNSTTSIVVMVLLVFSVLYFFGKAYLAVQKYRRIKVPHKSATVAQKYPSKDTMRGNEKSVKLRQQLPF